MTSLSSIRRVAASVRDAAVRAPLAIGVAAMFVAIAPAQAQTKAAFGKSASEFATQSQALGTTIAALQKRAGTASPYDKEMLNLMLGQLGKVDAIADGVLALGYVAAEMRDAGDLAAAKKQLVARCSAFKKAAESSGQYMASLAANIAAKDIIVDATKAKDLTLQMGGLSLCAGAAGKG